MSEKEVPAAPRIATQRMLDKNFGVASFKFNVWSAELEENQSIEDVFTPSFWASQAEKIMGHDRANPKGLLDVIEIRKRDTGTYLRVLVTEVGPGFIKVVPLEAYQPAAVTVSDGSPFVTKWNIGRKSHDVIRRVDGALMANGFQTKAAAVAWIDDHLKKLAA